MTERNVSVNPNICINPIVREATDGKGYCNPDYRRRFRDETTGCAGCSKPGLMGVRTRANIRDFMSAGEIKEAEIGRQLYQERVRRAARRTGKYLRM